MYAMLYLLGCRRFSSLLFSNVVNKDLTEATEILEALGFKVESVNKLTVVILDKVYSQNPAAGSLAPKGSTITLEIV